MNQLFKSGRKPERAIIASLLSLLALLSSVARAEQVTSFFEDAKLVAPDGDFRDSLGRSVALEGDTLVVGSSFDDDRLGSAYVFERSPLGAGGWELSAKLVVPEGDRFDTFFGSAVAISGDTIVIGAENGDGREIGSGSVYVFERGADGKWVIAAKVVADDGEHRDCFGSSVARLLPPAA